MASELKQCTLFLRPDLDLWLGELAEAERPAKGRANRSAVLNRVLTEAKAASEAARVSASASGSRRPAVLRRGARQAPG